ncbi:MAG TPA: hypothetical protein VIZ28_00565 [Chitinophagaceae bacterium]
MKTILANITTGWNFIKVIRVLAGIFILVSGIMDSKAIFILFGSGFLLFSLFTPGTCCALYQPPAPPGKSPGLKDIEYEEVGIK